MPTLQDQIDALRGELEQAKAMIGFLRLNSPRLGQEEWIAAEKYETASGDLNLADNLRQLRIDWAKVWEAINALQTGQSSQNNDSATSFPPASEWKLGGYSLPMRPLTSIEQRATIDALSRGGYDATQVELGFIKGEYPLQNASVIDPVKEIFYRDSTPGGDKAALKIFLAAIDQRDLATNALLSVDDPRVVRVSGTLSTGVTQTPAGSAQVVYSENIVMVNPETGFTISLGMSKNDDGLSVLYNYKFPWSNGEPSNPKIPQSLIRMERDGGVSVTGAAAQQDANGNPVAKGQYDGLRGKDVVIYPSGFARDGQGKSRSVDIACMQTGRTLRLGASTATATPSFPVEIFPDRIEVNGRPL